MAHASRKPVPVPPPPPPEDEIVLTLSLREATVLKKILQRVGGHPERTARRETEAVDTALGEALGVFLVEDDVVRMSSNSSITMTEAYQ